MTPEELSFAHWQSELYEIREVREALRQADSGRLIPHSTVKRLFVSRFAPKLPIESRGMATRAKLSWSDAVIGRLRSTCESVYSRELPLELYLKEIFSIVELIRKHPGIGRPGRVRGTREWHQAFGVVTVVYREICDEIQVLGLLVCHRKWLFMKTARV